MKIYDLDSEPQRQMYIEQNRYFLDNRKKVEMQEHKDTRTNLQNSSRWLYLQMVSEILNERGETFEPKGMTMQVKYNKDNLYHMFWQTLRSHLYPNQTKQLNTKQFVELVDLAMMFFAQQFSINIPYPNIQDLIHKRDIENEL